ncbi:MAG: tRNA pseudouridine(55) synthase TruB [Oscillospiraceae bacterium]|nr:tRNA pseudouridine(55) synthase TruB [Oscillospiraceae bacterium]
MTGILLIDKPEGWTSSDVVAKLRGILREKRIGHAGTLDPLATGLLVVLVGRATRAASFAEAQEKEYLARLRPGCVTDTQDITGTRIGGEERLVTEDELLAVLPAFCGEIEQVPPMYSAIKVKGQKLYEIARRGGEIERAPRRITVSELRLTGRDGDDFLLTLRCSKGTYVRTLCHDIGRRLGCGACMSALRRTRSGSFSLDGACTIEQVQRAAEQGTAERLLLPVDRLFEDCPALTLTAAQEKKLRCGNPVPLRQAAEGRCRAYGPDGSFLALCRAQGGELLTIKSFFEV